MNARTCQRSSSEMAAVFYRQSRTPRVQRIRAVGPELKDSIRKACVQLEKALSVISSFEAPLISIAGLTELKNELDELFDLKNFRCLDVKQLPGMPAKLTTEILASVRREFMLLYEDFAEAVKKDGDKTVFHKFAEHWTRFHIKVNSIKFVCSSFAPRGTVLSIAYDIAKQDSKNIRPLLMKNRVASIYRKVTAENDQKKQLLTADEEEFLGAVVEFFKAAGVGRRHLAHWEGKDMVLGMMAGTWEWP